MAVSTQRKVRLARNKTKKKKPSKILIPEIDIKLSLTVVFSDVSYPFPPSVLSLSI